MKGHKEADCWKKNPDKAPEWYQTKKETAGGAVDVEVMLCNIKIEKRVDNAVYAKAIIDHLNGGATNDLDVMCTEIDAIQLLTKTTN